MSTATHIKYMMYYARGMIPKQLTNVYRYKERVRNS